ncbi:carbonyl reductase [NADPH] 1-like isoform X2 [Actinia tenebrosa]|uniref:carbonyl reductase (NADPH) n=1 Tax=Actinia tenebrosa TaxID=6105 RepID=A0A6P8I1C6_ACTTE|nr:carbonyl reductase [NADPH] 1-like isoform X2 [Actinia tenebrosa]
MASRVAVVTGSNKGVGFAIVRSLCKKFDGTVILTARNEELGKKAVDDLKGEGLSPSFHQLDITSDESIQRFKEHLQKTFGGLDLLVNNAGIAYKQASTAPQAEQAEVTIRTNFTGTLNVSNALFPLLRPHARVVNIASMVGHLKVLPNEELRKKFSSLTLTEQELVDLVDGFVRDVKAGNHVAKGWPNTMYGTSKVAVVALTKVQARKMQQDPREDILINCCCPGWVRTDMAGPKALLSIDEGAVTPVLVSLLPEGSGYQGEFFREEKVVEW